MNFFIYSNRCSQVIGTDDQGFTFQRTTSTAINSAEPKSPVISMKKVTRGFYDETIALNCSVHSLVPFAVRWFHKGKKLGNKMFFRYFILT